MRILRNRNQFLLFATLLVAGCSSPLSTPPQASPWGPQSTGISTRFTAPVTIEQNAPLAISLELRCDPAFVPSGVGRFDRSQTESRVRLTLKNTSSSQVTVLNPFDLGGPTDPRWEQYAAPLDGRPLAPFEFQFLTRPANPPIAPGTYECTLTYSSRPAPTVPTRPADVWSGDLRTAARLLTITPEIVRPVTSLVPTRLRLTKDRKVVFDPHDSQRITANLGNGMFLGTRITTDRGAETLTSGTPDPTSPNPIDDWRLLDASPTDGHARYTLEVFATADPPHHFWGPHPGFNQYQTLWQSQFTVRADSAQP